MDLFQALSDIQPALKPLLEGCLQNRKNWQALAEDRQKKEHDLFSLKIGKFYAFSNNVHDEMC